MRLAAIVVVIVIILSHHTYAQQQGSITDSLSSYIRFYDPPQLGFLLTYFPPFFFQYGMELKSFIRSKTFTKIRQKYGDLRAVDAIYIRAMSLSNGNTSISLLISTIACFDHRMVGLKVPLFALFFPLSDESDIEFNQRINNLPQKIYDDTPKTPNGDRDKLQHFFGSAFIAYTFESREPAEEFSSLIEEGEEAFIVGGVNDARDVRSNRHGQKFGLALLENNHKMPSKFFLSRNPSKLIADSSLNTKVVPQGVK